MNIVMINKSDCVGGAAKVAWHLKQELQARGHTVNFFVADKTSNDPQVFIIPVPRWRFYLSHLTGTDTGWFKTDYLLDTEEFKQADLILCHNLHGHYFNLRTLVKMSRFKPIVWTLHDLWAVTPYCSQAPQKILTKGFYACPISSSKSIMKYFNQGYLRARKRRLYRDLKINLVAPSLWLKNKLANSILAHKPLSLIHHGLLLDNFQPEEKKTVRQHLGLPEHKKIVLFVASGGRQNLWKGWQYAETVIDDFKNQSDVLFLCIGGQGAVGERPNLQFIDYVEDEAVLANYFKAADAFLLTSTAESFALVVLEALAAGLPVVSFPVGVVEEVVRHKDNGYIAKYLDSQDLIAGLDYVLKFSPEDLERLVVANKNIITADFSLEIMTKKYLTLFEKLITENK